MDTFNGSTAEGRDRRRRQLASKDEEGQREEEEEVRSPVRDEWMISPDDRASRGQEEALERRERDWAESDRLIDRKKWRCPLVPYVNAAMGFNGTDFGRSDGMI